MAADGATVLIEDNEDHAFIARWALKRHTQSQDVVWLKDGEEALRYLLEEDVPSADTETPSLILLDINLPKVDGKEVLRQIRSCDRLGATPVVMLTTSDDQQDMAECYALGANSYVVKPAQLHDLTHKLHSVCHCWHGAGRKHPEDTSAEKKG